MLRFSKLGYVAQLVQASVTGTDTTRNINAAPAWTNGAPTILVASQPKLAHSTVVDESTRGFNQLRAGSFVEQRKMLLVQ